MGYKFNTTPEERKRLEAFRQEPLWTEWVKSLHPNTRQTYEASLFKILGLLKLTPRELITQASKPETAKDLSKRVKLVFAELAQKYSTSTRYNVLSALKSLLALNELELSLIGLRIKRHRKVKPLMTWEESERVIGLCSIEYQPAYKFMRAAAMDQERFVKLNGSPERIELIKKQLADPARDWIKIDVLEGRKSAPPFYCLVPRAAAELLPVLDQHGKPITIKNNIIHNWRNGMNRAGLTGPEYDGFGCHNLRSVWLSEAQKHKLDPVLMQHQLGHNVDPLNYQRVQQDVSWAINEFRKAWETKTVVTEDALASRDAEIARLRDEIERTRPKLDQLDRVGPILEELDTRLQNITNGLDNYLQKNPRFRKQLVALRKKETRVG